MIAFKCPICDHGYKVRDEMASKRAKCPKCDSVIVVPAVGADAVQKFPVGGYIDSKREASALAGRPSMVEDTDLDVGRQLRGTLVVASVVGSVVVIGVWTVYLAAALFDANLLDRGHSVDVTTRQIYFWSASLLSVLSALTVFVLVRRTFDLLQRGVLSQATITNISGLAAADNRPVTFSYVVKDVTYRVKRDFSDARVAEMYVGAPWAVIYDPKHPGRCEILTPRRRPKRTAPPPQKRNIDPLSMLSQSQTAMFVCWVLHAILVIAIANKLKWDWKSYEFSIVFATIAMVAVEFTALDQYRFQKRWHQVSKYLAALIVGFTILAVGSAIWTHASIQHEREQQRQTQESRDKMNEFNNRFGVRVSQQTTNPPATPPH